MLHRLTLPFSAENFKAIQRLALKHIGLVLTEHKQSMIYNRLIKRVRDELGLTNFDAYIPLLENNIKGELHHFINCVTTNLTAFFRENQHFIFLEKIELPALLKQQLNLDKIRIWSAGCSTGEEAYSLAIVAQEIIKDALPVEIIASDIDSAVLTTAQQGIYTATHVAPLSPARLKAAFLQGTGTNHGSVKIKNELKQQVYFVQDNLLNSKLFTRKFHIIFCRNVLIYFNQVDKKAIIQNFTRALLPDGLLVLGHSESLYGISTELQHIDNTIYRKPTK